MRRFSSNTRTARFDETRSIYLPDASVRGLLTFRTYRQHESVRLSENPRIFEPMPTSAKLYRL